MECVKRLCFKTSALLGVALVSVLCLVACAELDQLMKPRVEGLQQASRFDGTALSEGGVGEVHVQSRLTKNDINISAFETQLIASIRQKRPDLSISQAGRFSITANLIANDVSQRSDSFDSHLYRWTKRRLRVSYVVINSENSEQVWSGIIETYIEDIASYEVDQNEKSQDKLIDAVVSAISKEEKNPYPSPPLLGDVARMNFEGFALNLPQKNRQ